MIYLDNAATTLKKPEEVYKKLNFVWRNIGANAGRGGHRLSILASEEIYLTREKLSVLFNIPNPENIAFCYNTTMALNMGIKGILKEGDGVLITTLEHNSVYRPVVKTNNPYKVVSADEKGIVTPEAIEKAIDKNTKLIVVNHASNVCKSVCDIEKIGRISKKHGCIFMVDSAQSAGAFDIDVQKMNIDLLAFAGHKGLYGPQGTGGLYVSPKISLNTIFEGGSGNESLNEKMPYNMPERLSAGTENAPGIAALGAGVDFVLKNTPRAILEKENFLLRRFEEKAADIKGIKLYTKDLPGGAVTSLNLQGKNCVDVSNKLDRDFNISVRSGFHCSALCHKMLKSIEDGGTVRFSFGFFNTEEEIDKAVWALNKISKE